MQLAEFGVRCPACRADTSRLDGDDAACACAACGARFPFRDGFLDLLPPAEEGRTPSQALMEWPPLIRIYESRLWRRSVAFQLLAGLSFERECQLIEQAAGFEAAHHVLDLACGSGIYARRFARALPRGAVVGLDLSAPMLRYAARAAREEQLANLLLVRGDAMELPFAAQRFDRVNCCGALHLFPDAAHVLGEVARVLRPAGRLTLAAIRRGEGARAERRARARQRAYGLMAFTPSELAGWLERAGFSEPRCLHAARSWLIMSALKPAREG
jgi:SAM-dependent methyltransferase